MGIEKKEAKFMLWRTEFKDFLECRKGHYIDYDSMCDLVLKLKSDCLEIEIEDRRLQNVFLVHLGNNKYSVEREYEKSEHRYGDGGEFEHKTFLRFGGKDILVSRSFRNYATYSDDSMDYGGIKVEDTYLLEEDLLGRLVFDCLSK